MVATLITIPLFGIASWVANGTLLIDSLTSYLGFAGAAYGYALLVWGIPATLLGLLTWPLSRGLLIRTKRSWSLRIVYGVVLGAVCGAVVGFGFAAALGGDSLLKAHQATVWVGYVSLIGAVTGLVWSGWYLAFAHWIGANRPEAG